ncbi:hypothetical protein [Crenothrix sp.]|uniref:hypothetical protein n=1 Tax=Crenothrix sp. TaxID=3100433 RepID=UPI00374DD034
MPKSRSLSQTSINVALLKIAISAGLLAMGITQGLANNDPLNASALIADYVPGNPGLEIAIPTSKKVGNKTSFNFDVFKLGTKIKLFSTTTRLLPGCNFSGPDYSYTRIGNNIVMTLSGYCPATGPSSSEVYGIHVYGVDVSTAAKTPWVKSYSGELIGTGIVPDKNKNGVDEVSVIVGTEVSGGGNDYSVYVYDAKTGATVATMQKYAVER